MATSNEYQQKLKTEFCYHKHMMRKCRKFLHIWLEFCCATFNDDSNMLVTGTNKLTPTKLIHIEYTAYICKCKLENVVAIKKFWKENTRHVVQWDAMQCNALLIYYMYLKAVIIKIFFSDFQHLSVVPSIEHTTLCYIIINVVAVFQLHSSSSFTSRALSGQAISS